MIKQRYIHLSAAAFSLVESVMALGILAFALVGLIGLLPTGLAQFSAAKQETIQIEIVKFIDAQVQQTDFSNLMGALHGASFAFNEEGFPVASNDAARIFVAETSVNVGGVPLPAGTGVGLAAAPDSLARVDVAILHQPSGLPRNEAKVQSQVGLHASDRGQ